MKSLSTVPTSCHLLFATQSGRAKACARRSARIISETVPSLTLLQNRVGATFDDEIKGDLQTFVKRTKQSNAFLLLFVSTTGDGEHTDTIRQTWQQLLLKSLPSDTFYGISFAIYSLGDRAYGPQYCAAGRKLAVRLMQLGATTFCQPGYGDDGTANGGVIADLDVWIDSILLPAIKALGLPNEGPRRSPSFISPGSRRAAYSVIVSDERRKGPLLDEWMEPGFSHAYSAFFSHLRPLTAYSYNGSLHRVETTGCVSRISEEPLLTRVEDNIRLTRSEWEQETRHIRLVAARKATQPETIAYQWKRNSLPYQAGDVASVIPSNDPEEVLKFLRALPPQIHENSDCILTITPKMLNTAEFLGVCCPFWPKRCTLYGWLIFCADIHALPEREDLRALSEFCSLEHEFGKDQRAKLISLSDLSGAALYGDYVLREKRSWADILHDFDSLRAPGSQLTVEVVLGLLSPIQCREFSIASSPSYEMMKMTCEASDKPNANGFAIELCVAKVEGTTPLGRAYHGLCSSYLSRLNDRRGESPSEVRMWIRPGTFSGLPLELSSESQSNKRLDVPTLFIGAGTGIAPLRGLIYEREAMFNLVNGLENGSMSNDINNIDENGLQCDNVLCFGCRKKDSDFYYEHEWQKLSQTGRLGMLTAFSRDQWHKIYVQQVLEKADAEETFLTNHLLHRNGAIYIAGGPNMARRVKQLIVESLARACGDDQKAALRILNQIQLAGRFSIEAWS